MDQELSGRRRSRKLLIGAAQYAISFSILSFLFYRASQAESFRDLQSQASQWELSNWVLLGGAFLVGLFAVATTFFRWWVMVRTVGIQFRLQDAFRLGFVGFLLNFVTVGVIGGDSLKAYFIAQQQPRHKTEAVSSVIADRLLGLYALAMVATVASLTVEVDNESFRLVLLVGLGFFLLGGIAGTIFVLVGGLFEKPALDQASRGSVGQRIVRALLLYRSKLGRLASLLILSLFTHVLYAMCVYMIALGLNGPSSPTLGQHLVMVSISNVAGSVPLPGGIGGFEAALDELYFLIAKLPKGKGLIVALGYRLVTIVIALIGAIYYLVGRREMKKLMQQAQAATEKSDDPPGE